MLTFVYVLKCLVKGNKYIPIYLLLLFKVCTSLLEDNFSDSEAEDSETSRSGQEPLGIRFPVMNDGEIDALMDIETTRGTKRQTRWGVSTFKG